MNLNFDINNIKVTEFGVGYDNGEHSKFVLVPVDEAVQVALQKMVETTWDTMRQNAEEPLQSVQSEYEPSEKHAGTEYLYMATSNQMGAMLFDLHKAENFLIEIEALNEPQKLSSYFVRLTDRKKRRLTGLRRASQFKGLLKKKNRLMRVIDDTLQIVEEEVFRLDNDFDLLIDSESFHILRPSAFEVMGKLKEAILNAVPTNINHIQQNIPFVDFENIRSYASNHPRAAKYLASIRSQNIQGIDRSALQKLCKKTDIEFETTNGRVTINEKHILGFLEVLDRRRYVDELDPNTPESYRAASREKIVP